MIIYRKNVLFLRGEKTLRQELDLDLELDRDEATLFAHVAVRRSVGPSVRWSVRPSVRPSVGHAFVFRPSRSDL